MNTLARFGVSIEKSLLKRFDDFIAGAGYVGRSEAIRDLIRARLVEEQVQENNAEVFGVFTFVYDHHRRFLEKKLNDVQHEFYHTVITTTHVHVDHDHCLEVILLKGKVRLLKEIALSLSSLKGVKHNKLILTSTKESRLEHHHSHTHH